MQDVIKDATLAAALDTDTAGLDVAHDARGRFTTGRGH